MSSQLAEGISGPKTPEVRAYLAHHRPELLAMLQGETAGLELATKHSKIMDGLLATLFPPAFSTMKQKRWAPVLLAAVGGYGRELLALKSDLDVRLLTTQSPERIAPIAEALLYPLWDAGVSIGHQVVTISDALERPKRICPPRPLSSTGAPSPATSPRDDARRARVRRHLQRRRAALISCGVSRERSPSVTSASAHSVYLLEPDVKNGAGGCAISTSPCGRRAPAGG